MAVGSMHIRHDYATWVDWEQKSVRSVCGVTTKRHLAGIPGITPQPPVVYPGDRTVWGWCMRCVNSAYSAIANNAADLDIDQRVRSLYADAEQVLYSQYTQERARRLKLNDQARAERERRERRDESLLRVPRNY